MPWTKIFFNGMVRKGASAQTSYLGETDLG